MEYGKYWEKKSEGLRPYKMTTIEMKYKTRGCTMKQQKKNTKKY